MENNEMLVKKFVLDQTSPNTAKYKLRYSEKVCKRCYISPDMMSDQLLYQTLDYLLKP